MRFSLASNTVKSIIARPAVGDMAAVGAFEQGPRAHLTVEDADTTIAAAAYIVQEGLRMVRLMHIYRDTSNGTPLTLPGRCDAGPSVPL
jgi:hypothetical protein